MLERAGAISTRPGWRAAVHSVLPLAATSLTDIQAQAILEMRLNRLTGLEQDKIVTEFQELLDADPRSVGHPGAPRAPASRSFARELEKIREDFVDARRTVIVTNS